MEPGPSGAGMFVVFTLWFWHASNHNMAAMHCSIEYKWKKKKSITLLRYWFRGMCLEAGWQAVCCIATLAEEHRRGGLSSAVSMPNVVSRKRYFLKRFIATVAFRALTMSPAMRGGRGGRGNHSEERWGEPAFKLQQQLQLALCTPSAEHPSPFSDQDVLTAFSTDMYNGGSSPGQISANTLFMCR